MREIFNKKYYTKICILLYIAYNIYQVFIIIVVVVSSGYLLLFFIPVSHNIFLSLIKCAPLHSKVQGRL